MFLRLLLIARKLGEKCSRFKPVLTVTNPERVPRGSPDIFTHVLIPNSCHGPNLLKQAESLPAVAVIHSSIQVFSRINGSFCCTDSVKTESLFSSVIPLSQNHWRCEASKAWVKANPFINAPQVSVNEEISTFPLYLPWFRSIPVAFDIKGPFINI